MTDWSANRTTSVLTARNIDVGGTDSYKRGCRNRYCGTLYWQQLGVTTLPRHSAWRPSGLEIELHRSGTQQRGSWWTSLCLQLLLFANPQSYCFIFLLFLGHCHDEIVMCSFTHTLCNKWKKNLQLNYN